ncbi:MAG: urea transporter, partial [Leptospiraceae bacterium]|nr:urea transporter [Leptospiraceae bacterium]
LLFGLSISLYYEINISLLLMLLAACVVLIFVTLALEHSLGFFFGLPVLSIPFVIISIMVYLAFYNYQGFTLKSNYEPLKIDSYFPVLPSHINFYFKSFGAIFFQSSPWAGLIFSLILFYFSRIAFFLSILGYASGVAFHIFLKGNMIDISAGTVGFNHMLTAIAVGGIFLVPSPYTFILAIFASISSALIASFVKIFFINFSIPVLALPFVTVSLLFLHVARLLRNDRFRVVDFLPGSPENNLDYYKTRLERFGSTILDIRLPFSGKWKVSQGYSGKFTHKNLWKESLDFMAVDAEGNIRKGKDTTLNDYYTFGLPVLAPAVGRVVKVVNHLEDNPPGEMDNKENWGNLVLIEHSSYLYSQLSHLQKDSVLVKEGDIVQAGMKLGLAGSSGRSPEPHIHLHFQSTPEVGSTTVPLGFTQYTFYEDKEKRIQYNHVPKEEDIISNIVSDFNMKSFFSLAPGLSIPIRIVKNSGKLTKENWVSGVDFWGNRFIEDEKSNRLIFFLGKDSFSCLDYLGNPN